MDNAKEIKEWKVYVLVAKYLRDILWRYHREKRIVKGKLEKSVELRISPVQVMGKVSSRDSKDFWDSIPMGELSPEQRKHLKAIMEKEVRE